MNYSGMVASSTILAVKGEGVQRYMLPELMRKLTPLQRECLVLWRGDHRHTQQQIADKLGITHQMVSKHVRAGINKLRRLQPREYTFSPDRLDRFDSSGVGVLAVM